ncbi:MAG TPA: CaiB/BaiF CoA-transferase family protein [Ktedonobacteraceae bacterium]|nr:CaiB/BaiF CoA-transferase family protein [Ktedonobacteraceae bacterium]
MKPLEGITVVALEQAIAAPFATRQLADLGARVIKIERPGEGDFARHYDRSVRGMASHFVWTNRSKESLTLDLKHPEANVVLKRLLAQADVFVHNLAPGAVDRLGFAATTLRETLPRLIICNISGYGSCGPYREKKAYDLLIQAESGLLSVTGTEQTPVKVGISAADIAAGMYTFSGILTALFMRERTGEGTTIEVSLLEALAEWMGYPAYYTAYSGESPKRVGAHHASIAPYGPLTLGDGSALLIGIQNEREWGRFCEQVLKQPELAQEPRFYSNTERVAHRTELEALLDEPFQRMTLDQAIEGLESAHIAYGQMRSMQEFLDHPQLKARGRWREVDSPVGMLQALLPPTSLEGVEPVFGPIPALGQHTDAILQEIGLNEEEIARMRDQHII